MLALVAWAASGFALPTSGVRIFFITMSFELWVDRQHHDPKDQRCSNNKIFGIGTEALGVGNSAVLGRNPSA
jgi:hypothetical protein